MAIWTLQHADTVKPLHEWGLTQCVISEQSLSMGVFTAALPGNMLRTVPWGFEDSITLRLGDVVKWQGVALSPKRQAGGSSEMMMLRFADPWYYLTHGSYLQGWKNTDGADFSSGMPALFANVIPGFGWGKRTVGEEIEAIITQANAYHGGSVMELGDLLGDGFGSEPIPQRVQNASYETVLRQALAWVPDAIQQWTYEEGELPVLSFVQREAATARTYSFADGTAMVDEEWICREDLVVRGVEISYMGRREVGDIMQVVDSAGATTGTRILRSVVDCGGNAGSAAPISPTPTPEKKRDYTVVSELVDYESADWWFQYGDTGAASAADIVVGAGSTMEFAPNAPENAGHGDLGGCSLQWLSGGIPKSRISANTRVALVTGFLTVRTVTTEDAEATPILTTEVRERRIVKMLVPVTKLNGDYEQILEEPGFTFNGTIPKMMGDDFIAPSGVAQVLYDAWKLPQYDGSFTLVKSECDEPVQMGDVINITDGLEEWETMRTQVQGITREIGSGRTTITTGTAAHLGVDEYLNQLRMNRMRNVVVAADLDQQTTGAPADDPPEPDELDDMVGPGSIKYSVLHGPQELFVTRANAVYKVDLKAEGGPTVSVKKESSGDTAALEPGKTVVENLVEERKAETTPSGWTLLWGGLKSIKLNFDDGLKITVGAKSVQLRITEGLVFEDGANKITLSFADGLKIEDGTNTVQLTTEGLTVSDGSKSTTYGLSITMTDGTKSTEIAAAHVFLADGDATNSITEEQMVINGDGKTAIYEGDSVSLDNGGHTASLDPTNGVQVSNMSGTLSAKPAGVSVVADGYTAAITPVNGLHLDHGAGSTVDISVVTDKQISNRETKMCEEVAGLPVQKKAYITRSVTEAV